MKNKISLTILCASLFGTLASASAPVPKFKNTESGTPSGSRQHDQTDDKTNDQTLNQQEELTNLAQALLSPAVTQLIPKTRRFIDSVRSVKTIKYADAEEYQIAGIARWGGDTPCGSGKLVIRVSYMPQFGFGGSGPMVPAYSAELVDTIGGCGHED